jgi:hypothetical protein
LIGDVGLGPVVFSVAILGLALIALYTIQIDELVGEHEALVIQKRRRNLVGCTLFATSLAERVAVLFFPSPRLLLLGAVWWFLFFSFVTWNQLRSLLRHRQVTNETLSLAISVYLLSSCRDRHRA